MSTRQTDISVKNNNLETDYIIFFHLIKLIILFLVEIEPRREEILERERIVSNLQAYIRHSFDGATLRLFGSSTNGFGFRGSDLDICLTFLKSETGEVSKMHFYSSNLDIISFLG